MDYSPAYIISRYLIGEEILTDPSDSGSWPVYIGLLPDDNDIPHNAVACIDTAGLRDRRNMDGENLFHHGVQIMLRAEVYNTGYQKAQAIATELEGVDHVNEVISSDTFQLICIDQTTDIVVLGQEEGTKRRELFSINFLVTLKEI